MGRYAHYVLLRAQCFGGMFDEIASPPAKDNKKKKAAPKPITSTALKADHLDAAKLLLKTGIACALKNGEECENTALAVERVASDLLGLNTAVSGALTKALKGDGGLKGADAALIKKWCEFYNDELQPQTRAMVKKTAPKLDAFGLFLPSRMGPRLAEDLLQKGLKLDETSTAAAEEEGDAKDEEPAEEEAEADNAEEEEADDAEDVEPEKEDEDDVEEIDEYEYDEEEEYYDDEDEL